VNKATTVSLAVLVAALGFVTGGAKAALGTGQCADPNAPGGEWRSYGGDAANTRSQPLEDKINPATAPNLAKAWMFNTADAAAAGFSNGGVVQNTPVVADGCVYLSTSTGAVFALNADTGERVWSTKIQGSPAGTLVGGIITGSPTVANGKVYVGVSQVNEPVVVALNQADGEILWRKPILDPLKFNKDYRTTTVSAPVLVNGMVFQGIMADEAADGPRGGYAFLNAETGDLIHQDWTISDAEYAAGYRGASVWCTAAADEETDHVYACGGNPASKDKEARYSNALLKIDADPARETFGQIVAAFKGNYDQYYPGLDRQPACDNFADTVPASPWSPTCAQLDLDFGASPSLYTVDVAGQPVKMLGDLQKSGVYYSLFADNMQLGWSAVVGTPGPTWNAASPAVSGGNVYAAAQAPNQVWGITKDRGRYRWVTPLASPGLHFEAVSAANGVVYTVDNQGTLYLLDAATGVPARVISMPQDVGGPIAAQSSHGVAIARNTVYAAASSYVIAYR